MELLRDGTPGYSTPGSTAATVASSSPATTPGTGTATDPTLAGSPATQGLSGRVLRIKQLFEQDIIERQGLQQGVSPMTTPRGGFNKMPTYMKHIGSSLQQPAMARPVRGGTELPPRSSTDLPRSTSNLVEHLPPLSSRALARSVSAGAGIGTGSGAPGGAWSVRSSGSSLSSSGGEQQEEGGRGQLSEPMPAAVQQQQVQHDADGPASGASSRRVSGASVPLLRLPRSQLPTAHHTTDSGKLHSIADTAAQHNRLYTAEAAAHGAPSRIPLPPFAGPSPTTSSAGAPALRPTLSNGSNDSLAISEASVASSAAPAPAGSRGVSKASSIVSARSLASSATSRADSKQQTSPTRAGASQRKIQTQPVPAALAAAGTSNSGNIFKLKSRAAAVAAANNGNSITPGNSSRLNTLPSALAKPASQASAAAKASPKSPARTSQPGSATRSGSGSSSKLPSPSAQAGQGAISRLQQRMAAEAEQQDSGSLPLMTLEPSDADDVQQQQQAAAASSSHSAAASNGSRRAARLEDAYEAEEAVSELRVAAPEPRQQGAQPSPSNKAKKGFAKGLVKSIRRKFSNEKESEASAAAAAISPLGEGAAAAGVNAELGRASHGSSGSSSRRESFRGSDGGSVTGVAKLRESFKGMLSGRKG